jgi:hypothetical protein
MNRYLLTLLSCSFSLICLSQYVKGFVIDDLGERIPFAKIWVSNTTIGTLSNGKGEYQLNLNQQDSVSLTISASGYRKRDTLIQLIEGVRQFNIELRAIVLNITEVTVNAENKRDKGKKLMKEVIARRSDFLKANERYTYETYCFSSLDKKKAFQVDSVISNPDYLSLKKMNITEWLSQSYYESKNRYRDEFKGFKDYTEKVNSSAEVSVSFSGDADISQQSGKIATNPYAFVNSSKDADLNIFMNSIELPAICSRPLISPLAFNALLYYAFYLERSFYENGEQIFEVRIEPLFLGEALFSGTIYIKDKSFSPVSFELGINPTAMTYFKDMHIVCNYEEIEGRILPVKREFIYLIKEGQESIHGNINMVMRDYRFDFDDSQRRFWLETQYFSEEAYNRDSSFWQSKRPVPLKNDELNFIAKQDSIQIYHESEEYLRVKDSTFNTLSVWDFLFNGVGFRNTFKKQSFRISGLINQIAPFGVGGYRHRLALNYSKEFKNAQAILLNPQVDYGFKNQDTKGGLSATFTYKPLRFSKLRVDVGDYYDMVNSYESIQGTIAPANRVRNQKVEVAHSFEVINGLYLSTGVTYSKRQDIGDVEYPEWAKIFGQFANPDPFETYPIFLSEVKLAYRVAQRYIIKGNKKIVVGTKWPLLALSYKKGYPKIFGGQSDFDFVEFSMDDDLDFSSLGTSELKLTAGSFLRKNNLRSIENKYFRTSDRFFFSDPTRSMQMLDTALNTSRSYMQVNFIHHFEGFFLNKIWLINKLKLAESIGGGAILIPEANFRQVEFYVGLERAFRMRKQIFKLGFYAVAADNNINKAAIRYKVGINFYDSFRGKWSY